MNSIRIAVVGLAFGEQLVRTVVNIGDFVLVAVADHDFQRAQRVAAANRVKPYRDAGEMLEHEELDALCVAVSPRSRASILEAAVARGIALFVEKPWAADLGQALKLYEICRRSSAPVMVAFSFRFHPVVQRLLQLGTEKLGSPWMCSGSYVFGWLPPTDHWLWDPANGNGFFNENSGHLLDVVCALFGSPISVFAFGGSFSGKPSNDAGCVAIRFATGAIASLALGGIASSAFSDFPRLDLIYERGQAHLSGRNHIWEELSWATRGDQTIQSVSAPAEALGATRYTAAMGHFAQCIRTGAKPQATIADGARAIALAEAIHRSIHERAPVEPADLSRFKVAER